MIAEYATATRAVRTAMDRWTPVLQRHGVTRSIDAPLLLYAAAEPSGVYAADYQQRTGCGNCSYLVKGLVAAGVIKEGPGRDARYRRLTLTAKGRAVVAELQAVAS